MEGKKEKARKDGVVDKGVYLDFLPKLIILLLSPLCSSYYS